MKTAVSIPDELFQEAERLASRLKTSRSQLYCRALKEFVARHNPALLTSRYDEVIEALDENDETAGFVRQAANSALRRVDW